MGNWRNWHLSVDGMGVHHYPNLVEDADKMFDKFVQDLKDAGHTIYHASMTYGAAQEVKPK
jgi:hypothetical protein